MASSVLKRRPVITPSPTWPSYSQPSPRSCPSACWPRAARWPCALSASPCLSASLRHICCAPLASRAGNRRTMPGSGDESADSFCGPLLPPPPPRGHPRLQSSLGANSNPVPPCRRLNCWWRTRGRQISGCECRSGAARYVTCGNNSITVQLRLSGVWQISPGVGRPANAGPARPPRCAATHAGVSEEHSPNLPDTRLADRHPGRLGRDHLAYRHPPCD